MYRNRVTSPSAFRPHPWRGIDPGPRFPELLVAYIEIVPTDGVKYEIDKHSGYLKVDRPQRFSSFCPSLDPSVETRVPESVRVSRCVVIDASVVARRVTGA
jgi:inorganic pyrophosphatase